MRTIKFRGRDFAGHWYIGDLVHNNDEDDNLLIRQGCLSTYIENETVGQFTGLVDKNGKDIYEGDIMNDPTSMCVGVVEWNSILCQFQLSWQNMPTAADLFFMVKCGSFVIGNIHDNPEMRKGGAK